MSYAAALPAPREAAIGDSSTSAEWLSYVLSAVPGAALAFAAWRGLVSEQTALLGFALSFVALNVAHLAATWTHVYLDRSGWRGAPIERVAIPTLLLLGALALDAVGGWVLLLNLQLYLSIHHAQMQNYGIARASQRRSGRLLGAGRVRLDLAACLLAPFAAWMWRSREICDHYRGAPLYTPPAWFIGLTAAAGGAALVAYTVREIGARRRGEHVDGLAPAIVVGLTALWTALLLAVPHPLFAIYAIASAHYVQYLYFVWRYQSRHPALGEVPEPLRAWMAPPARIGYLASLVGIGLAITGVVTLLSLAMRSAAVALVQPPADAFTLPAWSSAIIAVNLAHYWLDSRIWRSGQQTLATVPLAT